MGKSRPKKPISLQSRGPSSFPRLDGDHLYTWAQLIQRWQQIIETKQAVAAEMLIERGYIPGQYLLTDDGYIVSRDQMQKTRPQSPTVEPSPQTDQIPDPDSPDSES